MEVNNNLIYYETLGLTPNSSRDDVKKTYRKLAKKYHPDINSEDNESERKFQEITLAYHELLKTEAENSYETFSTKSHYGSTHFSRRRRSSSSYRRSHSTKQSWGKSGAKAAYRRERSANQKHGDSPVLQTFLVIIGFIFLGLFINHMIRYGGWKSLVTRLHYSAEFTEIVNVF